MTETSAPVEAWPDPSDAVLLELGRIVWAAINLEDVANIVCSLVLGPVPNLLGRPTGQKIEAALREISTWPQAAPGDTAAQWLCRARDALKLRHSIFHATPGEGHLPYDDGDGRFLLEAPGTWLQYFPREGRGHRPRMLTSADLRPVREELTDAFRGWSSVARDLET